VIKRVLSRTAGWVVVVACFWAFLGAQSEAAAATYYISPTGNNASTGTLSQPWRTIQYGIDKSVTGDVLMARQGIYNENPIFSGKTNVSLRSYNLEQPIVRGVAGTPAWAIISVNANSSGIVLDGLSIDGQAITTRVDGSEVTGIALWGSGSTVRNCAITGVLGQAKSVVTAIGVKGNNNLVEGNTISDIRFEYAGQTGASQYRGFGVAVEGQYTTIRGNRIIRAHRDAIYLNGSPTTATENANFTVIENNVLGESAQEDGVMFDQSSNQSLPITDCVVRNNTIYGNAENGIDLKGTLRIQIYGNRIFGNTGNNNGNYDGVADFLGGVGGIAHGSNTLSTDITIYNNLIYDNLGGVLVENGYKLFNNVIYNNNRDYTGGNSTYDWSSKPLFAGIQMVDAGTPYTNVVIKNNIIGGQRHAAVALKGANAGNLDIDHNLYFGYTDPGSGLVKGAQLVEFTAKGAWSAVPLTSWQQYLSGLIGVTGRDAASVAADPGFADPAAYDFHITAGSPAIDAGTSDGAPATDIEGAARFDVPQVTNTGSGACPFTDLGAYEYQQTITPPPPPPPPPAPAPPALPVVTFATPLGGAVISGATLLSVTAAADAGIAKVEFYLDGELDSVDTSAPYTTTWHPDFYASGNHTLTAKAYDTAGQIGTTSIAVVIGGSRSSVPIGINILLKFKAGTQQTVIKAMLARLGLTIQSTTRDGTYQVRPQPGTTVQHAVSLLLNESIVVYAELNNRRSKSNDAVVTLSGANSAAPALTPVAATVAASKVNVASAVRPAAALLPTFVFQSGNTGARLTGAHPAGPPHTPAGPMSLQYLSAALAMLGLAIWPLARRRAIA
jgi:parallel beta-helix repeat protein